jgi:hypothetical protein
MLMYLQKVISKLNFIPNSGVNEKPHDRIIVPHSVGSETLWAGWTNFLIEFQIRNSTSGLPEPGYNYGLYLDPKQT